jgi:tRNA A-37 threonylcarbamoyl transferase component Bud32
MANQMLLQSGSRVISYCLRLCAGLGLASRRFRAGGTCWTVHPAAETDYPELEAILAEPEKDIRSRRQGLFRNKSDFAYHDRLVVKRYNARKPSDALLDLLRPSKATFAFRKARLLEEAGLPVARALAAAYAPWRGLVRPSYLVMERVRDAGTYRPFFEAGGDLDHARTLGQMIGRLHASGLRHRDLRCENLLEDGKGHLWFIDMEGIRVQLLPRADRVLRDLRALHRNFARFQVRPKPGVLATFWRAYLLEQPRSGRHDFMKARRQVFAQELKKSCGRLGK